MGDILSSRKDPRIAFLDRLKERSGREEHRACLVEGLRELRRAWQARCVREVYFCPHDFPSAEHGAFLRQLREASRIPLQEVSAYAFAKISRREGPDGLLGVGNFFGKKLKELVLSANPLLLVAERIEKPGNLGALVRSADSAGADALVLLEPRCDLYNPNAIRASQGAIFSLPVALSSYGEWKMFCQDRGWQWILLTPRAEVPFWSLDLRKPTALILGSEKDGLEEHWFEDPLSKRAQIPQCGVSDSLNVSVAAAVVLYEALRQRRCPAV